MKIAIITGASSGVGAAFLPAVDERFPELDEIWLIARREERLNAAARKYPKARPVPLDLADPASYERLNALLNEEKPDVRIVINNAGFARLGYFEKMDPVDISQMVMVDIMGMTMVHRLTLPYMHEGSFAVMTCSVSAFGPGPREAMYSASKKFMYYLGKATRFELRKRGVNVLLFCPGNMDTEMNPKGEGKRPLVDIRPYLDLTKVTREALKRAERGSGVYTPGFFYKLYRLVGKVLPSEWMIRFMDKIYG